MPELTEQEIRSQPAVWRAVLDRCRAYLPAWRTAFSPASPGTYFVGCGTSYYLAQSAAALFRGRAVPASELLLFPGLYLDAAAGAPLVAISRSGATSETVAAARRLRAAGHSVIAVTCRESSPLAASADHAFVFPEAFDRSVVMTRSFSGMLLALAAFAQGAAEPFAALPAAAERLLAAFDPRARELAGRRFGRFVFLGQGPLYGLAREASLKMQEMSLSASEPFHSLEVRHGPKSLLDTASLAVCLASEVSRAAETGLLAELAALGAATLRLDEGDADVNLDSGLDLYRRLPLYILPCQLLALAQARAQGLDPDHPRALAPVVETPLD